MEAKVEHCENCGKVIGKLEQAYIYESRVVCKQCNESLRHPVYVTLTKSVSGFGIAALVLGLIACLTCWIPFVGILGFPLAILGILFGSVGIIVSKLKKRSYVGLPIAGTIVSLTAAVIVIAVTSATTTVMTEGLRKTNEQIEKLGGPVVEGSANKDTGQKTEEIEEKQVPLESMTIGQVRQLVLDWTYGKLPEQQVKGADKVRFDNSTPGDDSVETFYKVFGKPKDKSLIGDNYYFQYRCKDGIVILEIPAPLFDDNDKVWISDVSVL